MEHYIYKNRQKLRCGYTTGSCAAAAAKAAAVMLLCQSSLKKIDLMTPKGILLHLDLHDVQITPSSVTCAVKKDSGDDPDITNGVLVYATNRTDYFFKRRHWSGYCYKSRAGTAYR